MSAASVLVVLDRPEAAATCLRAAAGAASALTDPRLEVLHVRLDPDAMVQPPEIMTGRYAARITSRSAAEATALRAAFDGWRATDGASLDVAWVEVEGTPAKVVRERSASANLLVLERPTDGTHPADAAGFDAALFDSGKPVLAAPPGRSETFGRHLAVGWRDTPATRASLSALRPWLMAAEKLSIIAVSDSDVTLPPDWTAAHLPRDLDLHVVRPAGRPDGDALLEAAAGLTADGIVCGAYRRGRILEWLLGGVTRALLRSAPVPVLMHL